MELSKDFIFEKDKKGKIVSIDTKEQANKNDLALKIEDINRQVGKAIYQLLELQSTDKELTNAKKFESAFEVGNIVANLANQLITLLEKTPDNKK